MIHFLKLFKEATFLISAGTLLTLFQSAGAAAAKERAPSVGSIFCVGEVATEPGGGGTWVFFGRVCAARDSKLASRSKKKFP